ncbi:hypothetical protein K438DRAFT_2012900 [Mycena galopus ATCC 62051]|nr:hypothetical protein K438DRAFT_2012900 [Mycena galopus ATCC 62051]
MALIPTGSTPDAFVDANTEVELASRIISCSLFVNQPNHGSILQVIPRLVINDSQVIAREDACSIRIASLILALRTGLEFQEFHIEEPLLSNLITGMVHCPSLVSVSTTRIPNFLGDVYKEASSGYQFLGQLPQVNADVVANCTQHTSVYTSGELISAALTSKSTEFFSAYRPMNITPESHFILIFTLRETSPILTQSLESSDSDVYSILSCASDTELPSSDFDPYLFDGIGTAVTSGSEISDWAHSGSIYPVSPLGAGDPILSATGGIVVSAAPMAAPYLVPSRSRSHSVSTEDKILLLLSTCLPPVVPETVLRDAKYVRRHSTLSGMIRNHKAMGTLLRLCGLGSSQTHTFKDTNTLTHSLTYKAVNNACGWSLSTYGNKNSQYQNSEKAARMAWRGDVPPNGLDMNIATNTTLGRAQSTCGPQLVRFIVELIPITLPQMLWSASLLRLLKVGLKQ